MQTEKAWLTDVLDKNKRMFQIPVYQRNYDWTNVQCEKLFEDILNVFQKDKKHFIGTIVYINCKDSSGLKIDLIIDGQQRITTVFILLKVMLEKAVEINEPIQNDIKDYLYNRNCDEIFKLKLKPIKSDNEQFKLLMDNKIDEMNENSNIYRNYKLFKKLINNQLNNNVLLKEILYGIKKLQTIEIVLDKYEDDPQIIFESINSTGLDLSLADKIRNFILMNDDNQEKLFNDYWNYLEKIIGPDNMEDYLINFLNFKMTESINSSKAYDKFKTLYINNDYSNEGMLKELKQYGNYYAAFIGRENKYGKRINSLLADYRAMDQSTIYPFLFAVFNDYECNLVDENTVIKILNFLRVYCFRRIICEIPSNSLRGMFKTLYKRLSAMRKNNNLYDVLYSFFITSKTKVKMPDEKEFIQKLKTIELYKKKKVCKFILGTIENSGSTEILDMSNLTIEHILPQQKNSIVWKKEIGEKYDEVYENYLHTLGNLTITGYNSELGTKPFKEKCDIIRAHSRSIVLNEDILDKDKWNENSIITRADNLARISNKLFKLEKCNIVEMEKESGEKLSLTDLSEATGTKPISISFVGEIMSVNSYADMLAKITNTLYSLDSKILDKLAKEKFKMVDEGRIYISYNEKDIVRGKELDNSGIYIEYNLSARDILQFIKKLLEIYTFDLDDFYFTTKKK